MVSREHNEAVDILMAGKNSNAVPLVEAGLTVPPSFVSQSFGALVERAFATILSDKKIMFLQFASYVLMAVFIGISNYDIGNDAALAMKNVSCIFFTILFTIIVGMMPTILTFPQELAAFMQDNLSHKYSSTAFYLARTLIDLPFQLLVSSIYAFIVYYLTSQPMEIGRVTIFLIICVLTTLVSYSLGLLLAVELSVKSNTSRGLMALATLVPIVLFAGFLINLNSVPGILQWFTWISYVRYGFECAIITIYGFKRENLKCEYSYCHFRQSRMILEELSMKESNFGIDSFALIFIFLAFQLFAIFLLQWKIRSTR